MRCVLLSCLFAAGCAHRPAARPHPPVQWPTPFGQQSIPEPTTPAPADGGGTALMIVGGVVAALGLGGVALGAARPDRSVTAELGNNILMGLGATTIAIGGGLIAVGARGSSEGEGHSASPTQP